jgi:oxygen-independent coproporphyrinogen-3 oxidase
MLGLGVASFSHIGGVHFQNEDNFEPYLQAVEGGGLPIHRALELSADEQLIREFVLQLKLGRIETSYFSDKFGVDVHQRFREPLAQLESDGVLSATNDTLELSRDGLLNVDRLLPYFFLDVHRDARYA